MSSLGEIRIKTDLEKEETEITDAKLKAILQNGSPSRCWRESLQLQANLVRLGIECTVKAQLLDQGLDAKVEMQILFSVILEQGHTVAGVLHFTEFGELKYMNHTIDSYSEL